MTFDPRKNVRFRGKLISELSREEMEEALIQALTQIHQMNAPHLSADQDTPYIKDGFQVSVP